MDAKMDLAREIIAPFHGDEAARKAADEFQRVFRERQAPSEVREYRFRLAKVGSAFLSSHGKDGQSNMAIDIPVSGKEKWAKVLVTLGAVPSKAEADRLIKQHAVEIDGAIVTDIGSEIALDKPATFAVRVGKKNFLRVVVE